MKRGQRKGKAMKDKDDRKQEQIFEMQVNKMRIKLQKKVKKSRENNRMTWG